MPTKRKNKKKEVEEFRFHALKLFLACSIVYSSSSGATHIRPDNLASYYHEEQKVACGGGDFNPNALTAAHKTLPCGTLVKVTNKLNGKTVTVKINDRGPYIKGRVIDLSREAAKRIAMIEKGVVPVKMELVKYK